MRTTEPTKGEIRVALAFTFAVLLGVLLLKASSFEDAERYDFGTRYAAGFIVRSGQGSKLYDVEEQARVQEMLFKGRGVLIELHPPFEALLYAPLTLFSYRGAYIVWGVVNIMVWMAFVYLMRPHASVPRQTFQYFALCFTFFPLWINMHHGQTSLLLLVAYSLAFISLKQKQDYRAGSFLALGLIKFQLVLPFALICALRGKWRFVAGFASTAIVLGTLSLVAVGPAGMLSYGGLLLASIKHPADPIYAAIVPANMPNLRGFFSMLLAERTSPVFSEAAVVLVSAVLILWTAWRWYSAERNGEEGALGLLFAAGLATSLLTGFYVYVNDLSPMLLAVLLAIGSPQWSGSRWRLVLEACIVTLYIPLVYLLLIDWGKIYLLCPVLLTFTLGIFGLLGKPTSIARDDRRRA